MTRKRQPIGDLFRQAVSMQLNQFRYLIAVDKFGSISRAAQELYISQSTISISLIRLEEELGAVLLNRSKRGVSLTAEGKTVLECAQAIEAALERLEKESLQSEQISGHVQITGTSHFCMNVITDVILQLRQQHPAIHVMACRDYIKDALNKVAQHEYDLAFITFNAPGTEEVRVDLRRHQLEFHQIFSDKLSICTRADHPLQRQEQVCFEDVLAYERVTLSSQKDLPLLRHFGVSEDRQPVVRINDVLNTRRYAASTDAVLITPRNEVLRSNLDYRYKLLPLDVCDFDIEVIGGWVHHGTHELAPAEACVVEALENICSKYAELTE